MATKVRDGRYKSTVFLGLDAAGKRKYKAFYAETADKADFAALTYKLDTEADNDIGRMTVRSACEKYIASKENILSPTTVAGYRAILRNYMQAIMSEKVAKISSLQIQQAINTEARTHSAKTVKNAYALIEAALKMVRPGITLHVTLPREIPVEYETPNGERLMQIFSAAKGTDLELPILLAAWLSLRKSEVIGLRWEDIEDDFIYVRNAKVYAEGAEHEKAPKNNSSIRKIPLPEYIKKLLDKQPHTSEFVCPVTGNALIKSFSRMLKANDIPHCRFHDLRHANASLMVLLGIPDRYAQQRGGWANGTTLSKRYQQTFSEEELRVAEKIDSYFENLMHTNKHTASIKSIDI